MTWCLDLVCFFSLEFFTRQNTIESLSKLLKQSPVKICCGPAALFKRDCDVVVSYNFLKNFQNTSFKEHPSSAAANVIS